MNDIERQILESLQFLISMKKPESEHYQDRMAEIMSKNHLLLYPIDKPTLKERTHNDLKEEDKGCSCGFQVNKDSKGCGKVIEEWTKEDDGGEIIDNGWYHCGENGMLCDECEQTLKEEKLAIQNESNRRSMNKNG